MLTLMNLLIAAILALGAGNVVQWWLWGKSVANYKTEISNLKKDKIKLETDLKNAKIEAAYAPKIEPMRKIAKKRQPKVIKPVVIEHQPPPKVDPQEWADAVSVAESINSYWGVRDGGKKSLPGKATDARVWPPPGRACGKC